MLLFSKCVKIILLKDYFRIDRMFEFFNKTGLDYVSCSPFRVPIARLAAAQAAINAKKEK